MLKTFGSAGTTVTTGLAAGVTLGQIDEINEECSRHAKFTVTHAGQTVKKAEAILIKTGEVAISTHMTAAAAVDVIGINISAGVIFGQDEDINLKVSETMENLKLKALDSKDKIKEVTMHAGKTV